MLRKTPAVTIVPAVEGRAYQPASHTCFSYPPPGGGGDSQPPTNPPPPSSIVPTPGTPIWLEPNVGEGYGSVAPAPVGYTCRYGTMFVYAPGQAEPAAVYYVICDQN